MNPTAVLSEEKKIVFEVLEQEEVGIIFQLISSALLTVRSSNNKTSDAFKYVLEIATYFTFFMAFTLFIAG